MRKCNVPLRTLFAGMTLFLFSLVFHPLQAQVLYGSLTGNVQDTSGAVIPRATVTITNVGTAQVVTTTTNSDGVYTKPDLEGGQYELTVTMNGFKAYKRLGITITPNTARREDITMTLGQATETVTVAAAAQELQTDQTDLHVDLSAENVVSLPLGHYRNFQTLINLVPGATPGVIANSLQTTPERSFDTNVNGISNNNNDTRIDGIQSVYLWLPDHAAYVPPAESIETVNISTNDFNAEQGMAGGVVTSVITKSGTNKLHGSVFAFNANSKIEARNFYNLSPAAKPLTNINIDGATIGGPIIRNKLFFFQSWEMTKERQGVTAVMTVPTDDQRAGNFSAYTTTIYDPTTGNADGTGRTAFLDNTLPSINPIAAKIQALIPEPNSGAAGATASNYTNSGSQSLNRQAFDSKVNYNRNENESLWLKYTYMGSNSLCMPGLGAAGGVPLCSGYIGVSNGVTQVADIGFTRTLKRSLIWDGTFGYIRMGDDVTGFGYGQSIPMTTLGIPGTNGGNDNILNSGAPQFIITGYSQYGGDVDSRPYLYHQESYNFSQNLGWTKGKHDLRFGFEGLRHHMDFFTAISGGGGPQGQFNFTEGVTGMKGGPSQNQYNSYAAFLLGLPQTVKEQLEYETFTAYDYEFGAFAQDRWQLSQKLTLSLGVRWELYPMMTRSGRGGIEEYNPATNIVSLGGVGGNPSGLGIGTSHKLFAPRLGASYKLNDKTVLRAGYGISFDPMPLARPLLGWYPLSVGSTYTGANSYTPEGLFANGIPTATAPDLTKSELTLPLTAQERYIDGNMIKRGYAESWNLVVQRDLPGHILTSVAYVGTQMIHQLVDLDVNSGVIGGGTAGQLLNVAGTPTAGRTAITWAWNGRYTADYHALQVSIERHVGDGLTLKGAYTYSRAIDYTDADGWAQLIFNVPGYISKNRAASGFDIPQNTQLAATYDLPFGKGKKYLNHGLGSKVLGGWESNSIFSARSGQPFTVTASATSLNAPDNTQTADQLVAHPQKSTGSRPGEYLYNPANFAAVTTARFGTGGRDNLYAPHWVNLDTSLFRAVTIRENMQLQFRAEAFNISNTPHFNAPNANVSTPSTFMTTSSCQQDQRNIRLGLRLAW